MNSSKIYAIVRRDAIPDLSDHFCPFNGHHFIDLDTPDSEHIFLVAYFHKEAHEIRFLSHPGVDPLPDFQLEGNQLLKPEHAAILKCLQPEGPSVLHAIRAAGRRHRLLKLSHLE